MNLRASVICLDCEEIYEQGMVTCPKCGSAQFAPLGAWVPSLSTRALGGKTNQPTRRREGGNGSAHRRV